MLKPCLDLLPGLHACNDMQERCRADLQVAFVTVCTFALLNHKAFVMGRVSLCSRPSPFSSWPAVGLFHWSNRKR